VILPDGYGSSAEVARVGAGSTGREVVVEYEHLAPLHARFAVLPHADVGRERLRAELIAGYLPVARNIARKYANRGENLDDVEQVASVGWCWPSAGSNRGSGPTSCPSRCRPSPGRCCGTSGTGPTRSGSHGACGRCRRGSIGPGPSWNSAMAVRHGRVSEIAEWLGVDLEVVIEGLAAQGAGRPDSLDEPAREVEGWGGPLRFGSARGMHEREFDLIEYREALAPLLAALSERERRILVLQFFDGLTQSEIGARVGISQMHVSRMLTTTLGRLRRQLTVDGPVVAAVAG
jgi:RNA polymerase sigma-B factor